MRGSLLSGMLEQHNNPINSPFESIFINRIAIIRIGKIGDMIVSRFAIRKIRSAFPGARILLVTLPRNKELLQYSNDVDEVRFFRKGADIIPLLIKLRLFSPDLLIDFNDNPSRTSDLFARFGGARKSVGFSFGDDQGYYDIRIPCPSRETTHVMERMRKIPEALGLEIQDGEVDTSLEVGKNESDDVKDEFKKVNPEGKPIIAINLSAGNRNRYWQQSKWMELLHLFESDPMKAVVVLLSAPDETYLADDIISSTGFSWLHRQLDLRFHHFASTIAQSSLLISPDTSSIHIADAFRVPVIGLYPQVQWNAVSWRPYRTECEIVMPEAGFIAEISVEEVWHAFLRLRRRVRSLA